MKKIAAVVLAAGRSQRMGRPKMAMPWRTTTVIGQVVSTLTEAGVFEIVVVTGGDRELVETALAGLPARLIYNPRYAEDAMLLSLQTGVQALSSDADAFLVVLGDQPQTQAGITRHVIEEFATHGAGLVVPSYQKRRGHPWLVARRLWPDLLGRTPPETMRAFLDAYANQIHYVEVDTDSILRDVDTPEDYQRERSEMKEN